MNASEMRSCFQSTIPFNSDGRLDILDNNAAFLDPDMAERDRDVEAMDLAVWDKTFAVNLRGTMLAAKAALPHLRASDAGAIVNTVSTLALQGHVISSRWPTMRPRRG